LRDGDTRESTARQPQRHSNSEQYRIPDSKTAGNSANRTHRRGCKKHEDNAAVRIAMGFRRLGKFHFLLF
jgi:hypothetical protein